MAVYEVQSPDGRVFEVEGPDNATDDQISAFAAQQFGSEKPAAPPEEPPGAWDQFKTKFGTSLRQRALGIAQLGMEATGNADTETYQDMLDLAKQYDSKQSGGGAAGFAGKLLGDPLTYLPIPGAAGLKGTKLVSKAAAKELAKIGAVTGAVYGGLEPVQDDESNRLANTAAGGAAGAAATPILGAAVPAAVKGAVEGTGNFVRGVAARHADDLAPVVEAMQQKGSQLFQQMRKEGMLFSAPKSKNIVRNLRTEVGRDLKLTKGTHSGTMRVMKDFEKDLLTQRNVGIDDLYAWRKNFASIARLKSPEKAEDAMVARRAVDYIDSALDSAAPIDVVGGSTRAVGLLGRAKKEWSQYKKFEGIADMVDRSDGSASKMQKAAKDLLRKTKGRGFSEQELAALKEVVGGKATDKTLAFLSRFGFGTNAVSQIGGATGAGLGFAAGGGAGAVAVPAVGTAARVLRGALERGKAERLLQIIEAGGSIPEKEVMTLPPKVAKFIIDSGLMQKAVGRTVAEE